MNDSTGHPFIHAVDRGMEVALRVVNVWAQGAGSVFEVIGDFLSGLLHAFGKILNGIPFAGKFLRGMFHWLGTIVSAGFDLAALSLSSAINFFANGTAGVIRILVGGLGLILARDGRLAGKGAADLLAGFGGAFIAVAAKCIALIHAAIFMQLGERALNDQEKAILRRVYRNSLTLQNIRLIDGFAGLFSVNNRPFALGNRIYMKKIDTAKDPGTLVHEFCHIWQYQRYGIRYIAEALWAQWTLKDAYNWEAEIESGHVRWQDFNREAQAQFIQNVFEGGRRIQSAFKAGDFFDDDPIGQNVEYKRRGVNHTDRAREAVTLIRNKGRS